MTPTLYTSAFSRAHALLRFAQPRKARRRAMELEASSFALTPESDPPGPSLLGR